MLSLLQDVGRLTQAEEVGKLCNDLGHGPLGCRVEQRVHVGMQLWAPWPNPVESSCIRQREPIWGHLTEQSSAWLLHRCPCPLRSPALVHARHCAAHAARALLH